MKLYVGWASWMALSSGSRSSSITKENVDSSFDEISEPSQSKWARRTAKKRTHVGKLLNRILLPTAEEQKHKGSKLCSLEVLTLEQANEIEWNLIPELDPQGASGGIKPNSQRGLRKRRQVEAFYHILETMIMNKTGEVHPSFTIIDAGSGAGNLAIPIAGLFARRSNKMLKQVLAMDVNRVALERLQRRANDLDLQVNSICMDLAYADDLVAACNSTSNSNDDETGEKVVVCSLHACGAASDLALRLAARHNLPFIVSPCCTAKAVTQRVQVVAAMPANDKSYNPSASFQRSGAPDDITYPRSRWLGSQLLDHTKEYSTLAKVADVGLGPQTPHEQTEHQQRAKYIVELDRLLGIVENYSGYDVSLYRIKDHENYGKSELLVGIPRTTTI